MILHVLSGACGSGKSTRARALGGYVLAFDDIRELWPDDSAADISRALLRGAHRALLAHEPLIVIDACNLHPHDRVRWETLAIIHGALFVFEHMTTPLDECIARDARRADPVGAAFIRAQFA